MKNAKMARARRMADPEFQAAMLEKALWSVMLLAVMMTAMMFHDAWVWTHPPQPKYFFVDGRHTPVAAKALDSPIVGDVELLNWTVHWVLASYSIDYYRYPEEFSQAGQHYTKVGWTSFSDAFVQSNNLEKIKADKLLCFAQAQRAAVIKRTMIVGGRLAYEIQFPMIQTCENSNQPHDTSMMMTAIVVRTDAPNHPDGIAIDQLVADRL